MRRFNVSPRFLIASFYPEIRNNTGYAYLLRRDTNNCPAQFGRLSVISISSSRVGYSMLTASPEIFYGLTSGSGISYSYSSYDFMERTITYICIACSKTAKARLLKTAKSPDAHFLVTRPFAFDVMIADECFESLLDSLRELRDELIAFVSDRRF
jgi:hypothetical protein